MLEYWSKANPRRTAIRESRPDSGAFWRTLRERGAMPSVGIAVVFCIILTALFLLREEVVRYRPGEHVPYDITARVDFQFFDKDLHDRQVNMARVYAPRVYRAAAGDAWVELETLLLGLPDRVHGHKLEELDPPLKEILDSGAITQLEQNRTPRNARLYATEVHQFVTEAQRKLTEGHPLVILGSEDWKQEVPNPGEPGRKVILRSSADENPTPGAASGDRIIDAGADAYSATALPESLKTRLTDYATVFDVALAPKIAAIAFDFLQKRPTFEVDQPATAAEKNAAGDHVDASAANLKFLRNMVIVPKENYINEHDWQVLNAENSAYRKSLMVNWKGLWQYRAGLAGLAAIITIILSAYIARYQARCVRNHTRGISLVALLLSMLLLTQLAGIGSSSLYIFGIAPPILVAMILTIAYDQRFAMGISTIYALIVTAALNQSLGFFLIVWTGVLTACYLLDEIRTRSKLIEVGGATALAMIAVTAAVGAVEMQPIRFIGNDCLYTGAAGLAAGFVVLGILPFIEKIFRITTAMTLLELADASQPLLRRLALEAPGTYNHSLQVATLAEAAAESIGANSLACRVGSYYHDIGKINKADYFVENQLGAPSRHLNLTPDLSLRIIIGHVKDGIEMAKEYNLPSSLLPFIHQHHGTTLVEYFYHQAQEKSSEDQPDISEYHFRYPGPKPKSRETAIVMICDAVESASRAMAEPTASRIEKLVHELSLKRLLDGQFDECDLTMRDLEQVERTLGKTLLGIYHGRIAYPTTSTTPQHTHRTTAAIKSA